MATKEEWITDISAQEFITKESPNRAPEALLNTLHLRQMLIDKGYTPADLDATLDTFKLFEDGRATMADVNSAEIAKMLPESLNQYEQGKQNQRTEINQTATDLQTQAYNNFAEACTQTGYTKQTSNLPRIQLLRQVIAQAKVKPLPHSVALALDKFSECSWYLVLLNHDRIRSCAKSVVNYISNVMPEISEEDVFQDAIISAYRTAFAYDPQKGPYAGYLTYLRRALIRDIEKKASRNTRNMLRYNLLYVRAQETLKNTEKDDQESIQLLTAMYSLRQSEIINFQNEDAVKALIEIQQLCGEPSKHAIDERVIYVLKDQNNRTIVGNIYRTLARNAKTAAAMERLNIKAGEEISVTDDDSTNSVELKKLLSEAFTRLSPRERFVLNLHYGLEEKGEYSLEEIGNIMGVTRERARQIKNNALRKLRNPTVTHTLRNYVD